MPYESMHPSATFIVTQESISEVTPGKRRVAETAVGSYVGGWEDLPGTKLLQTREGRNATIEGNVYADPSVDPGVQEGHVVTFTDPATSQVRVLRCIRRWGPFDPTDPDDHFMVVLGSEQAAARR